MRHLPHRDAVIAAADDADDLRMTRHHRREALSLFQANRIEQPIMGDDRRVMQRQDCRPQWRGAECGVEPSRVRFGELAVGLADHDVVGATMRSGVFDHMRQ